MSELIRIEAWREEGGLLHAQEHTLQGWLIARRLSGGVVWLCTRAGRPSVALVFRDAAAPAYPNTWSYFAGAADSAADVELPWQLAREGSEELVLRAPDGRMTVPMLLGASAALPQITAHMRRRFPDGHPNFRVCDELRDLACHRVRVQRGATRIELPAFASVHQRESSKVDVLELIWFGQLGEVGDSELLDAEVDASGAALERTVIAVELAELSQFMQSEPIATHARATLEHLTARAP